MSAWQGGKVNKFELLRTPLDFLSYLPCLPFIVQKHSLHFPSFSEHSIYKLIIKFPWLRMFFT